MAWNGWTTLGRRSPFYRAVRAMAATAADQLVTRTPPPELVLTPRRYRGYLLALAGHILARPLAELALSVPSSEEERLRMREVACRWTADLVVQRAASRSGVRSRAA